VSPGAGRGDEEPTEEEPVIVGVAVLLAEETTNSVILARLGTDLARLPEPPSAETLDAETELALEALNLDVAEFEAQYVNLLRRSDGNPPGGFFVAPVVTDETASERPVALSGLIGLLAGGILASDPGSPYGACPMSKTSCVWGSPIGIGRARRGARSGTPLRSRSDGATSRRSVLRWTL